MAKGRIYELAVDHILNPNALKVSVLERNYAIAYQNAFQVDLLWLRLHVIEVNFVCQIWDVLSSV